MPQCTLCGNDMRIPRDDHRLRINMEILKLKDSDQDGEHRGNQPSLLRGQNSQLIGWQVNPEAVTDNKQKRHRKMTDKGREYDAE